ncbi:hypothetical protein BJI67_15465 [Acidihalobacter aeolianus]|uniref:Type 4 fimbrial biogenesis protein PilX N-terminal domain-containing protein n=2 Tax=Acidihalobacter aeolianus TaxID=2792603 RepID=A0A1D8KBC5_9GAMM|nr:hypothetical protein BJI67_15465 [Acidihalobacter aeolianus]
MNRTARMHKTLERSTHRRQEGFVLVVSLLILVILTLLGVSMFGNVGLQQRMASNTREKNRAFEAAQSALQYAQWWLTQGSNATQGVTCPPSSPSSVPLVCTTALSNPTTVPWAFSNQYAGGSLKLDVQQLNSSGVSSGGANSYYSYPQFYIQYIGFSSSTGGNLYRITAWAYGGNQNAIAVVQSVFLVGAGAGGSTPAKSVSGT